MTVAAHPSAHIDRCQSQKRALRAIFRQRRRSITTSRRQRAAATLATAVTSRRPTGFVLSYCSFNDELDTGPLNAQLSACGWLVLPRITGTTLTLYRVDDPQEQLRRNSWGILEPSSDLCLEVSPREIALAVVPALAFDASGNRLGYGKGFYDRLAASFTPSTRTLGVGFTEQKSSSPLPVEALDVAMNELLLF